MARRKHPSIVWIHAATYCRARCYGNLHWQRRDTGCFDSFRIAVFAAAGAGARKLDAGELRSYPTARPQPEYLPNDVAL